MHYKRKYLLGIIALISFNAVGVSWPYDESTLLNKMNNTYSALESKTGACMDLSERKLVSIQNDWLYSQDELKQKIILLVVSRIASERCVEEEKTAYTMALMNYTSETEDKTYIDKWLVLNKSLYTQETLNLLSDVDPEKIISLSKSTELSKPFDPRTAYELITPESK